jgi:amidase
MKLTRRSMSRSGLVVLVTFVAATAGALTGEFAVAASTSTTSSAALDVSDASVVTLQAAMQSGKTSSQAIVRAYLARIKTLDKNGPRINSVI